MRIIECAGGALARACASAIACAPYFTRPTPVAYCGPCDELGDAADADREADAHRHAEDLLGELRHALEEHRAAGEDDAGRELLEQARVLDALADDGEDLLDARLDDVARARGARCGAARGRRRRGPRSPRRRRPCGRARSRRVRFRRSASAIGVRRPAAMSFGDVVAADRDDARVGDAAVDVEQDVGGAAADVDRPRRRSPSRPRRARPRRWRAARARRRRR